MSWSVKYLSVDYIVGVMIPVCIIYISYHILSIKLLYGRRRREALKFGWTNFVLPVSAVYL